MNIHPIFTHFPIALFTLYALLEIARFKWLRERPYYFYLKAFTVISGTLFSLITLKTGELAEGLANVGGPIHELIEMHSKFANVSAYIFGLISIVYFMKWIDLSALDRNIIASPFGTIWIAIKKHAGYILRSPFLPMLALIGLIMITITGSLGGAIVYGPDADPVVHFIYNALF